MNEFNAIFEYDGDNQLFDTKRPLHYAEGVRLYKNLFTKELEMSEMSNIICHNLKTLSPNAKRLSRKIQYFDFKTIVCQMFHYNFWSSAYYRECSDISEFA